jgi:DNA-binding response OmpR family regulator
MEDSRKPTVLLVDDDASFRGALTQFLEIEGFSVFGAKDGVDALRLLLLLVEPPDLIAVDQDMPHLGGREMIAALQGDPVRSRIPVVMLSCRPLEAGVSAASFAGFFAKPLDPYRFVAMLRGIAGVGTELALAARR